MGRKHLIGDFLKRIKRPILLDPDKEYKLVTIKMNHNGIVLRGLKKGLDIKSKMYEVKEGDFILSGIDARNGAFGIVPKELDGAIVTNDFWYFEIDENIILKKLFLELTATTWFDEICRKGSDGTTQRIRLQKDKFFNQTITLPSKEHQTDLLKKLLTFKSKQIELTEEIHLEKQYIAELKQSILKEAIQGKLTEGWCKENRNIESAEKLLERIKEEKEKLVKEKKLRKEKALEPIVKDEIPFELPDGWVWCRLGDLGYAFRGKSPKYDKESNTLAINQKCVRWGYLNMAQGKGIKTNWFETIDEFYLTQVNDVLVNSTGEGTIGRSAIVKKSEENLIYDSHVLLFRPIYSESIYIKNFINSLIGQQQIDNSKGAKSTNQTELGVEKLRLLYLPLPPVEEQKEIVKQVEMMMNNISILDQEIIQSEQYSEVLMQAILKEVFEG